MQVQINQLFDKIHTVPQIPEVVRTLITQFNDPNINFDAIAKNIEKEQMISLKVLRLVNSAHFGLSKKIGTIQEAVIMLGMHQLRILVIASGMVNSVPKIEGVNLKQFWEESFRTSTYAKWLAAESKHAPDLAFTAGLISGLGYLLIHMGASSAANEIDQHVKNGSNRLEMEKNRLGFTQEDVCAELCKRWNFSSELVQALAQSGNPLSATPANKTACAVNIARYISQSQQADTSPEAILGKFPFDVAAELGLSEDFFNEKLAELMAIKSPLEGLVE